MVAGMHRSLSEHAARQAGDLRDSMKSWLQEAHSIWNRPPPTPDVPPPTISYVPGQPASSGLGNRDANTARRVAKSATDKTAHPQSARRERSRSPQPAGDSASAAAATAKQGTTPARVKKPRAIAAPKPRNFAPSLRETEPAPPPSPPPSRVKKPRAIAAAKPPTPAPPSLKRKDAPQRLDPPPRKRRAADPPPPSRKRTYEPEAEPEAEPPRKRRPPRKKLFFAVAPV